MLLAIGFPAKPVNVNVAVPPLLAVRLGGLIPVMLGGSARKVAFVGAKDRLRNILFEPAVAFVTAVAPAPVSDTWISELLAPFPEVA